MGIILPLDPGGPHVGCIYIAIVRAKTYTLPREQGRGPDRTCRLQRPQHSARLDVDGVQTTIVRANEGMPVLNPG